LVGRNIKKFHAPSAMECSQLAPKLEGWCNDIWAKLRRNSRWDWDILGILWGKHIAPKCWCCGQSNASMTDLHLIARFRVYPKNLFPETVYCCWTWRRCVVKYTDVILLIFVVFKGSCWLAGWLACLVLSNVTQQWIASRAGSCYHILFGCEALLFQWILLNPKYQGWPIWSTFQCILSFAHMSSHYPTDFSFDMILKIQCILLHHRSKDHLINSKKEIPLSKGFPTILTKSTPQFPQIVFSFGFVEVTLTKLFNIQ
jgi:hypothetical protein